MVGSLVDHSTGAHVNAEITEVAAGAGVEAGFFLPIVRSKPPPVGSGKLDRFDRLPEKTDKIQISNKKGSSTGFHRLDW